MKRFLITLTALAVVLTGGLLVPKDAVAVPAFSRQVGVPCLSCHYQHIPKLNSFGREFKLGGMTQASQELIEDEGFSLPPALNLGFILKYRYKSETMEGSTGTKKGTERGLWQIPGGGSIWLGGRLAESWGSVVEFGGEGVGNAKVIYSRDFGGTQGGVSVYTTNHMGAAFGMELFNTGAVKSHSGWDNANATSAMLAIGDMVYDGSLGMGGPSMGAATGFSLFAGGDLFFVNVGLWGPLSTVEGKPAQGDVALDYGTYYRLAITPKLSGGLDLMVGLQGTAGSTKGSGGPCDSKSAAYDASIGACTADTWMGLPNSNPIMEFKTSSMALDFQVQKDVGDMTLEVTGAYVLSYEFQIVTDLSATPKTDITGYNLGAALGITPKYGVKLSYLSITNDTSSANNTDTAISLGAWANIAQNIVLTPEYVSWGDVDTAKGDSMKDQFWLLLLVGI